MPIYCNLPVFCLKGFRQGVIGKRLKKILYILNWRFFRIILRRKTMTFQPQMLTLHVDLYHNYHICFLGWTWLVAIFEDLGRKMEWVPFELLPRVPYKVEEHLQERDLDICIHHNECKKTVVNLWFSYWQIVYKHIDIIVIPFFGDGYVFVASPRCLLIHMTWNGTHSTNCHLCEWRKRKKSLSLLCISSICSIVDCFCE